MTKRTKCAPWKVEIEYEDFITLTEQKYPQVDITNVIEFRLTTLAPAHPLNGAKVYCTKSNWKLVWKSNKLN